MQADTRRLVIMLLLGLAVLPLPVVYAGNAIDADIQLPPDATATLYAHGPSLADEPTATPTPDATATATLTPTPLPPPPTATPTPVATATSTAPPAPATPPMPLDDAEVEQFVVAQLNQPRIARGLAPLRLAPELAEAARGHSRDMADNGFTDHAGSDGSDAGQRMAEAGYQWTARGEIIGWGYGGDAAKMVNWWMNCPVHRPIVLSGRFEDVGVGYVSDPDSEWGYYWTVNFGRPVRSPGG
jgi:uncharacterized protein YkwD